MIEETLLHLKTLFLIHFVIRLLCDLFMSFLRLLNLGVIKVGFSFFINSGPFLLFFLLYPRNSPLLFIVNVETLCLMNDHHRFYNSCTLKRYKLYRTINFYFVYDYNKTQNQESDHLLLSFYHVLNLFYLYDVNNHIFYKSILFK